MADPQPTLPPAAGSAPAPTSSLHTPPIDPSDAATSDPVPSPTPSPTPPSPSLSSSSTSSTPPLSPLSSALYSALQPALVHCDQAITTVFTSQSHLASQIDTLATLLSTFTALHTTTPQLFTPYTAKLQSAKRRIRRLQAGIGRVNGRLDEMRDVVRRKEGLVAGSGSGSGSGYSGAVGGSGGGGLTGRLGLSSIVSIAQQALVGGSSGMVVAHKETTGSGLGGDAAVPEKAAADDEKEDESVGEVGEIESIEALVPVLDKSAAPTTYGSLPTSAPSPTAASAQPVPLDSDTMHGTAAGVGTGSTSSNGAGGVHSGAAATLKSVSLSSAPSSTVLLHDLLAWDVQ